MCPLKWWRSLQIQGLGQQVEKEAGKWEEGNGLELSQRTLRQDLFLKDLSNLCASEELVSTASELHKEPRGDEGMKSAPS